MTQSRRRRHVFPRCAKEAFSTASLSSRHSSSGEASSSSCRPSKRFRRTSRRCSLHISAPVEARQSITEEAQRHSTSMCPIWFLVRTSLEKHVTRWCCGCWKRVLETTRRFADAKLTRWSPLVHLVPTVNLSRVCHVAASTGPCLAFQSPATITMFPAGTTPTAS